MPKWLGTSWEEKQETKRESVLFPGGIEMMETRIQEL